MEASFSNLCFGLNRETDEQSLRVFVQICADKKLLDAMVPRLSDRDLNDIVELWTGLMKKYLSHQEYHGLFLDKLDG